MREADDLFAETRAYRWHLYRGPEPANKFPEEVVRCPSWKEEHVLQRERLTQDEKEEGGC